MARVTLMASGYADDAWPVIGWLMSPDSSTGGRILTMSGPRAYADSGDAELLAWSASGDRRAFDEIVTRHGPFALRVATRLVPDQMVAEDIVQEAMVRAWSQAGHFDRERALFTTWLYRVIVNLCIDYRRRKQPERLPDDFDAQDPAAGADELMETSEQQTALAGALRELPPRQRAALTLVYDEGLSGAETARVLGLSAKAVERLLSRARALLRERLQPAPRRQGSEP
jgi:RNA polymerase sigma-70 factor (ECF subfamily)